ncbi:hypothetical protein [Clostridioides difficile]|nr:hypothetical protein [Clostridioides difficile]AXU50256.1 hypothetical protein CDIF29629_02094 [Clostridioides difficile]MBS4861708.1 hypothetical protein [Clostridioides difficile]MCI4261637.1 hypothetical protein [Clostridioides difficile]MCK1948711.1 hypothetical protein [Clostridioides difficile]MCU5999456.1 hypothetical protein [Clostridioides difficile]
MIKIERKPKSKQLTEEYKKTYGIKNTLFVMANGKCCYCETKLMEEGKYM